ncbi:hypothetical protein [Parasynechococcus sp.]|uniref:hypothetical protein n=1 Tax=Parasynechococcus sp. TaxID=3101203 RepID=UPI00370478E4
MASSLPLRVLVGDLVVVGDPGELQNNPCSTNWFLAEVLGTSSAHAHGNTRFVQVWNVDSGVISWEDSSRVTRALGRRRDAWGMSLNTDCGAWAGTQHWKNPIGGIDGGNHSTRVLESCDVGVIA